MKRIFMLFLAIITHGCVTSLSAEMRSNHQTKFVKTATHSSFSGENEKCLCIIGLPPRKH